MRRFRSWVASHDDCDTLTWRELYNNNNTVFVKRERRNIHRFIYSYIAKLTYQRRCKNIYDGLLDKLHAGIAPFL